MGRLIDADKLKVYLQEYLHYGHAIPWLDAQLTAYNVEKVVAELEERKGNVIIDGKIMYQENYFIDIDSAIDIVKAGGVDG